MAASSTKARAALARRALRPRRPVASTSTACRVRLPSPPARARRPRATKCCRAGAARSRSRRPSCAFASRWQLLDAARPLGEAAKLRVYPELRRGGALCLAGRRPTAAEIGIKSYQQRGSGTDFKQLADYRPGDSMRHIDWKATLRHGRPIVREFQDERDQCVVLPARLRPAHARRRRQARDGTAATSTQPSTR